MRRSVLSLMLVVCLTVGGCDSGSPEDQGSSERGSQGQRDTTDSTESAAALERAVRAAVRENNQLAGYVLWHNEIPSGARQSTRGPALSELRESAARRRNERVRVRTVSNDLEVAKIRLDPSYTRATATVRQAGRVIVYRRGRRLGGATRLNERASVELRRPGAEPSFVVWEVTVAR